MPLSVKDMLQAANAAVPRITPDEAEALMMSGKAVVVDVRDAPELRAGGKVPGALHVSRGMLEFKADPGMPSHDKAFDPSKTIILYCASGGRSALAGKVLKDMGYPDVRNLGGFKDWIDAGKKAEAA
jgi:rhodanese-related sulfurtransferase